MGLSRDNAPIKFLATEPLQRLTATGMSLANTNTPTSPAPPHKQGISVHTIQELKE